MDRIKWWILTLEMERQITSSIWMLVDSIKYFDIKHNIIVSMLPKRQLLKKLVCWEIKLLRIIGHVVREWKVK